MSGPLLRLRSVLSLLFLLALSAACNEAQPAVNRVQPNAVEKGAFEGEWFYLQTVIDTPHTVEWTFVGEQSLLDKIEWDIQEDLLVARRSYEWINGGEGPGISGAGERGAAIAIYAIESHFDIRREYNSVTGEEMNVVVENDTDRPWFEREFMRVDWSQNLVTEAEFLSYARFDGVRAEPVAYYVEDPSHPNAPRFDHAEDGTVDYFDVVNKMFVEPTTIDLGDGWGEVPSCWLEYQTHVDCAPAELTIRHSFLKVGEDRDFQPSDYSGDRMERFGYFVSERPGYDPDYGIVEPARSHFVNRHDLWEASYRRDAEGNRVACSEDADCDPAAGSMCDRDILRAGQSETPACTIPYRERVVKPIAYHVSERFPEDLVDDARVMVDDWNQTFVETIGSLRENECLAGAGDAATCAAERDREDARQAFVLCNNPVSAEDHPACGEEGTVARVGDLRYSLVAWVHEPHLGSPLGFGPASVDPETGEAVQANAFIYGAGVDELAAYARDIVALLNGDLAPTEIVSGQNVERWVETLRAGERSSMRPGDRHVIAIDGSDARDVDGAMGVDELTRDRRRRPTRRPASRGEMVSRLEAAKRTVARGEILRRDDGRANARLHALRDTPIEALMTGPQMLFAAGVDPRASLDDAVLDRASPLRGLSPGRMAALERHRRRLSAERCVLRAEDFTDDGLLGLARAVRQAVAGGDGTMEWYGRTYQVRSPEGGTDYDAVRDMLRHPIFSSTAAHEVGHTLGLRHNFSGSYDALNYAPRYWELRNDGSMRPRAYDPLSPAEIEGRIREYQYSTVMDYGNNFVVTDSGGLGHYDFAAIKMGYGDLVEVFSDAADPAEMAWVHFMQAYGWPVPLKSSSFYEGEPVSAYAYTELPGLLGGVDRLQQRADVPYASLRPEPTLAADGIDVPLVDESGRPAVPYRFCSDEFSDLSPDCMAYDAGGDQYEALQSVLDTYWHYYLFANFRRERVGYDVWQVYDRIYWRYFSKLIYANQDYVFNRIFLDEVFGGDPSMDDFYVREDGMGPYTTGVGAAFSMLTRVIATPEPGPYVEYLTADGGTGYFFDEYSDPEIEVPIPDGRFLETTWNWDAGYYWLDQLERVGYFYDKILAVETLTDPQAFFLGEDAASDLRGFSISYHTTFPDATSGLLAGLLGDRWDIYGARPGAGGSLVYPSPQQLADGSMPGVPIDPSTGYSVELYGAIYAMAFIPLSYDHTFLEQARIFVAGGAEGIDLPVGERVEFVDPFTSLRYVAASYPDETGEETGLAARMLLHAQALETEGELVALEQYMDIVNLMRTLSWEYGFGI